MPRLDVKDFSALYEFYKRQLVEDCAPFWLEHSLDRFYGGYLTMLQRDGAPYGTRKYVWPQARQAYMWAKLYNAVDKRPDWLEAARIGVDFLAEHALDENGRAYFKLSREGTPLVSRPGEIYAECFILLAWAEYARASGQASYLDRAETLYGQVLERMSSSASERSHLPAPLYREHAPAMIMINTTQELRAIRDDPRDSERILEWVRDELHVYARDEQRAMLERVGLDGKPRLSEPEGRSITPGHSLESGWFCLEEGLYQGDAQIVRRACQIIDWTMALGWDDVYGGLYNFLDVYGKPPGHHDEGWGEDQDWDAKLYWVHSEALYALLLAYRASGDTRFIEWYEKVHHWAFKYFPDALYGEWFGYLRRDGSISQTLKGGIKSMFHLPRALLKCMLLLSPENRPDRPSISYKYRL